jgi:hypothetical protein
VYQGEGVKRILKKKLSYTKRSEKLQRRGRKKDDEEVRRGVDKRKKKQLFTKPSNCRRLQRRMEKEEVEEEVGKIRLVLMKTSSVESEATRKWQYFVERLVWFGGHYR